MLKLLTSTCRFKGLLFYIQYLLPSPSVHHFFKIFSQMEPFTKPVDITEFPTYEDIVVHPVDFTSLERNIKRKFYGSTEAFSSDARWIVHNSVIFNGGKILELFFLTVSFILSPFIYLLASYPSFSPLLTFPPYA